MQLNLGLSEEWAALPDCCCVRGGLAFIVEVEEHNDLKQGREERQTWV